MPSRAVCGVASLSHSAIQKGTPLGERGDGDAYWMRDPQSVAIGAQEMRKGLCRPINEDRGTFDSRSIAFHPTCFGSSRAWKASKWENVEF